MRTGGRRRHAGPRNRIRALRGLLRQGQRQGPRDLRAARRERSTATCTSAATRRCSRDATFVVEAIVEDPAAKAEFWRELDGHLADDAVLATTTSSLPVSDLARGQRAPGALRRPARVQPGAEDGPGRARVPARGDASDTRERARALCEALGKTAVEVPDTPGFVVNRLLFPFLFEAVRLMERTGLDAEAIDTCMRLGRRPPDGPARAAGPRRARRQRRDRAHDRGRGPRARSRS